MNHIGVPEGTGDIIDCRKLRESQEKLSGIFAKHGFTEVSTPILEYYDLFLRTGTPINEQFMLKAIDSSGRICVLRPDSTTPIARLAATRLSKEHLPLKLWYIQPVFRSGISPGTPARSQILQAGVEYIGESGLQADADMLSLCAECLSWCDREVHIEISWAGIFTALCKELCLPPEKTDILRALVLRKSFAALKESLQPYSDAPAALDLIDIMCLSGGTEVLAQAAGCRTKAARDIVGRLSKLMELLPKSCFSVDLGMLHPIEYYTGLVFKGYISGIGYEVLTGGRYDNLLGLLGRDAPAIGFAMDLDRLLTII
ncbi:MAG: ATP phosphoribosyltransferase regulatory subunit [Oscillospiraceae bacterium]|nr:ATP phosphoribosyltransferase regulatory subunit [Oscillospiraceae bacterium]